MTREQLRSYLCAVACPRDGCKLVGNVFTVARHLRDAHGWPIEEAAQFVAAVLAEADNQPQGVLFTPGAPPASDLSMRDP